MFRIGHGYDVHRLMEGRKLVLGGVEIPFAKGLLGHSDADVLIHAIMDALLGALALGDIGKHFPDHDPAYRNIDSRVLLRKVHELIAKRGYAIANLDSTVCASEPKLASYLGRMRENLAQDLHCSPNRISVKATTEEGLGVSGDGAGMAAHCVVLLRKL
jgi:2-C-methyl-D-erythritol 2,4-cyclodiphosphate synthase